ncbi:hypothetical protein Bca4012_096017 [Brassica carinata]
MQTKVQSRLIQFWEAGNFYKGHSHPRVNPTFKFADAPIFIRFSEQSVFYEISFVKYEASKPFTTRLHMALNASWLPFSLIGRLFLNATLDIHFYFDNDCVASINYLKKVCGFDEGSSSAPTKYNGVKKIESIPPSELNSHVLTASPEAVEFICTVVVNAIFHARNTTESSNLDSQLSHAMHIKMTMQWVLAVGVSQLMNEGDQDIQELALPQSLPSQPLPIQLLIKTSELHSVPHL